jgi:hypothetical protein
MLEGEEMVLKYKFAPPIIIETIKRMKSLNKEFKILNLQFIMLLNKKP